MAASTLLLLSAAGVGCIAIAAYAFVAPTEAESRLESALRISSGDKRKEKNKTSDDNERPVAAQIGETVRASFQAAVGSKLDRSSQGTKLTDKLIQADVLVHPAEWLVISGVVAFVVGLLVFLRFGQPLAFPIGAALGYFGTQQFLSFKASKRRRNFDSQLSPALIAISGALKAGYTFVQAVDLIGKHSPKPMSVELGRVVREYQLGVPIGQAMARMVRRVDSDDLALVHTAVQIQAQSGGNLGQVLDRIEFTIRERIRIKGEIKTLTGQARASGWILIILPFALGGILSLIAPSYFTPMFKTTVGQMLLGFCLFMIGAGYAIIRKIVSIKV